MGVSGDDNVGHNHDLWQALLLTNFDIHESAVVLRLFVIAQLIQNVIRMYCTSAPVTFISITQEPGRPTSTAIHTYKETQTD